jgi:MOSC domain-containing protein YiiM
MTTPAPARPHVLVGPIRTLGVGRRKSAIDKRPTPPPWLIGSEGLEDDRQANRTHHGGLEKALHHYPFDHYPLWRAEIGDPPLLAKPGAFGENLSTEGWTELNVCVGDMVRFGKALLQVSQGRQPCLTLNLRFSRPDMALRVQKNGRAGWYYRVIEAGVADADAALQLVARPRPDWPLARLNRLLYVDPLNRPLLAEMASLPELADNWRSLAARRLANGKVESWTRRLYGSRRRGEEGSEDDANGEHGPGAL